MHTHLWGTAYANPWIAMRGRPNVGNPTCAFGAAVISLVSIVELNHTLC